MPSENKLGMLQRLLRALGLLQQSADDVVNFIINLLAGEKTKTADRSSVGYPYHLRDHFLTPAELKFYEALQTAVEQHATICTKVNLNDIFYVQHQDSSRFRTYTNKIDRKHLDFLLCDPLSMKPMLGIELDDRSHQRKDRKEQDTFVNEVFGAAGLPLIHIPVGKHYQIEAIQAQIEPLLNLPVSHEVIAIEDTPNPLPPVCPNCGTEMSLRTARKGAHAGEQFWGCPNYPACRTMLPYHPAD